MASVSTPPPPGPSARAHAIIEGEYTSAEFEFRARSDELFSKAAITPGPAVMTSRCTIPISSFNVYAVGKDKSGAAARAYFVVPPDSKRDVVRMLLFSRVSVQTTGVNGPTTQGSVRLTLFRRWKVVAGREQVEHPPRGC